MVGPNVLGRGGIELKLKNTYDQQISNQKL